MRIGYLMSPQRHRDTEIEEGVHDVVERFKVKSKNIDSSLDNNKEAKTFSQPKSQSSEIVDKNTTNKDSIKTSVSLSLTG